MLITAKDIIKKTLSLYRENFKIISPYLLMLFAITGILTIIQSTTGTLGEVTLVYGYGFFTLIYFTLVVTAIVLTMWFSISLVRITAKIYNKEKIEETKVELQKSTHLIIPAFLISFLVGIIVILGIIPSIIAFFSPYTHIIQTSYISINPSILLTVILWIIYAIFVGILLTFSYYSVIVDEHKVIQSLKTSTNLVKHRWWATFWRLLASAVLFTIILLVIQWLVSLPTNIIFSFIQTGTFLHVFFFTIFSLLATLVGVFFTPLTTFPAVILYEELKKTPYIKNTKKTKEETPAELPKL